MRMKFLLDMDGVLVDFVSEASRVLGIDPASVTGVKMNEIAGITEEEMWDKIDAEGPDFWANLPEYPWTDELLNSLGTTSDIILSTSPSLSPSSVYGKRMWMVDKFGWGFTNYMMGSHKHLMAGSGYVLIDDHDKNVDKFREHGGEAILFPQPWNSARDQAYDPLEYVAWEIYGVIRRRL